MFKKWINWVIMKKLKMDLDDIAFVMEQVDDFGGGVTLFDTMTGEVMTIPNELMEAVETCDDDAMDSLPDWEIEMTETAKAILSDEEGRFVEVPRRSSQEGYDLMVEFAESLKDARLKEKLDKALDGKGAFGWFKNVLSDYPIEEKRWFAFKNKRLRQEVIDWLNSIDIIPDEESMK